MSIVALIVDYFKEQLRQGFAPICLIVGRQRIGKTSLGLRLAYEFDKNFDIESQFTFKILEFVKMYDKFENKILILDEAGVELDSFRAMEVRQRVLNHVIQTQAYKHNLVFFILPFASEIGKAHRKHVNVVIDVYKRKGYKAYASWSWRPDMSMKPPRLSLIEDVYDVPLPPPHIWDKYKAESEMQFKQSILTNEKELLSLKENTKKERPVYATQW